jgi:hypothetical protein
MADAPVTYTAEAHAHHMAERDKLTDAARESSRTFDKAILTFGAAVFGASVAFLKDVAPKPQAFTIKWLAISWACFIVGLLAVILSFLFSHRACLYRIDESEHKLLHPEAPPLRNRWATWTGICNFICVIFLFFGVGAWTVFALENLANQGERSEQQSVANAGHSEKGARPSENSTAAAAVPVNSSTATTTGK